MARRGKSRGAYRPLVTRPAGEPPAEFLTIKVSGPPGCGKTTALEAIRLLLADAGFKVGVGISGGLDHDGEQNLLMATPNPAALDELRDWMKGDPA